MLQKAKEWIKKAEHHLEIEFSKLQAWRANPAMVEDIKVDSYGSLQPIKNVATISILDPQTLSIQPWNKSIVHAIAKAITDSWMWLNPQTMADSVIIKVPVLTEERRKELVKVAKRLAEEAKISVRNARGDSHKIIKTAEINKEITEDEMKSLENDLQKLVDEANKKIEEMLKKKETDIMKV